MVRFISDMNKVVLIQESGTYAATSGNAHWLGQVTAHSIEDSENKIIQKFLGTLSRSYDAVDQGPRDIKGTLTYNMQDARIPFFAIGSVVDLNSGTNHIVHYATQVNTNLMLSPFTSGTGLQSAPMSFTLEDSKQSPGTGRNFIRTIRGCVPDEVTITAAQGEKVSVECSYIGQTLTHSSGATTTLTEVTTTPYLWNNATLTIGGSTISTAKEIALSINNNIEAPHYLNGSRDIGYPFPKMREISLDVTLDLDGNDADMLYNSFYKTNTVFNTTFDLNRDSSTGSQHTIIFMSGCRVSSMENPSAVEGPVESTITIRPQSIIGSAIDTVANYNPW